MLIPVFSHPAPTPPLLNGGNAFSAAQTSPFEKGGLRGISLRERKCKST